MESPAERVPDELWWLVFWHLLSEDLIRLLAVCRRWRRCLLSMPRVALSLTLKTAYTIALLTRYHAVIERIHIQQSEQLVKLGFSFPKLTHIVCHRVPSLGLSCPNLRALSIENLSNMCSQVMFLEIKSFAIDFGQFYMGGCAIDFLYKLEEIRVTQCFGATQMVYFRDPTHVPNLRRIQFCLKKVASPSLVDDWVQLVLFGTIRNLMDRPIELEINILDMGKRYRWRGRKLDVPRICSELKTFILS